MHLSGPNLDFEQPAVRPVDGGVNRTVIVLFGLGNVILEAALDLRPNAVNNSERGVALIDRVHKDANTGQIVDLGEILIVPLHLQIDAPEMFDSPRYLGLDTVRRENIRHEDLHLLGVFVTLG